MVVLTQDYEDGISIIYDDYHAGKTIGEYSREERTSKGLDILVSMRQTRQLGSSVEMVC